MTIKQAFQRLAAVCGAGMKNPFFVQRNLHDTFAIIADDIEGDAVVKIWENPDNTQSFGGQTIETDVTGTFKLYIVLFGSNGSTKHVENVLFCLDGVKSDFKETNIKTSDGSLQYRSRGVTITTSNGKCSAVFTAQTSADNVTALGTAISTTASNARNIPYVIYGIR